jgi:hypothetical protein
MKRLCRFTLQLTKSPQVFIPERDFYDGEEIMSSRVDIRPFLPIACVRGSPND